MANIYERLRDLEYQILRGLVLTDQQKIDAVRSIYDAAINEGTVIPEEVVFPSQSMGVTIVWSPDKKSIVITLGDLTIEDNLIDSKFVDVNLYENYLFVNNEEFMVGGDNLLVETEERR